MCNIIILGNKVLRHTAKGVKKADNFDILFKVNADATQIKNDDRN
jgi:hypothetical protein